MTDKTSDDIINELFHSLNLPPLPEKPIDKNKKRTRALSTSSNDSSSSDNHSVKRHKQNGNEKEKRKHHKSKKKKKHKKKSKKEKYNKDECKTRKEEHTKDECEAKKEIDMLNHDKECNVSKECNDYAVKTENGESEIIVELNTIKLPGSQSQVDFEMAEQLKPSISEEILTIYPDSEPIINNVEGKPEIEDILIVHERKSDKNELSIDSIPLPVLSINPKPIVDSSLKEISQAPGKGKPIIIKNLKDSLVFTLAEEVKKNTEVEIKHEEPENACEESTNENNNIEKVSMTAENVYPKESLPVKEEIEKKHKSRRSRSSSYDNKSKKRSKKSRERSSSDREKKYKRRSIERSKTSRRKSKDRYSNRRERSPSSSRRYSSTKHKSSHRSRHVSPKRSRGRSHHRSPTRSHHRSSSKSHHRSSPKSHHRSPSKSHHRSPSIPHHVSSRSKHKSPSQSDNKSSLHNKNQVDQMTDDNSDLESQIRMKAIKNSDKEASPDCVDLLRDKATRRKLLEVAKKNAVYMMKNDHFTISTGNGKPSGKSVEELTNFCKQLASRSDNEGSGEYEDDMDSEPDSTPQPFSAGRHPFLVKDRPIMMNIRNAPMIKPKSNAERLVDQSKLREQFPVSSGSLHRNKVETGWVTVDKEEKVDEKVFPENNQDINISELVSTRISAMRKLQNDPSNSDAIVALTSSQKTMQDWALSKQAPGQFTGSTGVRILSQGELAAGHQAWARKEQFREANPVSSHFGLKMLQKMGWNPGEGLGKHKEGTIEPLLLDVKMDKKGLHAQEEVPYRKVPAPLAKNLAGKLIAGKHPVSALVELCSKRKWGPPEFQIIFDSGPDHKKNFLMKVLVNHKEYRPSVATSTKKIAKANAAASCLQALGVLPKEPSIVVQMQPSTLLSPFEINSQGGMTLEEMQQMPPALIPTPAGRPPQG